MSCFQKVYEDMFLKLKLKSEIVFPLLYSKKPGECYLIQGLRIPLLSNLIKFEMRPPFPVSERNQI